MSVRDRIGASPFWSVFVAALALWLQGCEKNRSTNVNPQNTAGDKAAGSSARESVERCTTPFRFLDVAAERGLDFVYRNDEERDRFSIVESMGGGVGLLDFDRDGWLDLCATGGGSYATETTFAGRPTGLFRAVENGARFDSIAPLAGIEFSRNFTNGVAIADIDHDGFSDVLLTGYGGLQCFHNQGDGTFREIAMAAGLTDPLWSVSAAWGDLNGDQHLDLYVTHYVDWSFENDPHCPGRPPHDRDVCAPRRFEPLPHMVYFSNGDGTYRNATTEAGLRPDGKGLGVVLFDVELDGDLDVYVANDTDPNFLYLNDGHGRLTDVSVASGAAFNDRGLPDGSMGIGVGDYDSDGLPDLFVTNYESETAGLYRNLGDGNFRHSSHLQGITAAGKMFVGWGVQLFDVDSDGDDDVIVANGHAVRNSGEAGLTQLALLFENRASRMVNVAPCLGGYFDQLHRGRGLAVGDLNQDGRLDVVVSHVNEPLSLLVNETPSVRPALNVRLVGRTSSRDAVGAIVELQTEAMRQKRQVFGGGSFASSSDRTLQFAPPVSSTNATLQIQWPSGQQQTVALSSEKRTLTIVEPMTASP